MGSLLLAIVCFVAVHYLRRGIKFCDAKVAECQAKLDEMDREEREDRRERLARLPRDPFPRPGGPATTSASR